MPADPRRVKELFAAALDLTDLPARLAFLDRECAGDADLRRRLEVLLHAHDQPQPALDQPLAAIAPADQQPEGPTDAPAVAPPEQAGTVLAGKYKLIERIGEGGMGSVWMAQQTEPVKRKVAVKLIKAGDDSKAILARFEAERQALALMDHPNIARVLDGGVVGDLGEPSPVRGRVMAPDITRPLTGLGSPRPFFVMELVKGVPITTFCDARKLTPRQRLELFVPVCQAIQHAHQKGIIHRDIKPSNVLVAMYDDRPVPKVIDFGVAKAAGTQLTDKTLHTGFGAIVGTPQFMSPEQATLNNLDIDTRSDIYSLGVLLYVLMTGSPPFRVKDLEKAGMLEILRVIREEEPPKPSTKVSTAEALPSLAATRSTEPAKLSRQLRGEIDWIVMKALEKDRARRYETANGFALDIERYLADEPVQAGPPSAVYRLKKFVKRHKGQVFAACVVLLVLLGGIAGTTWGLLRAETAWTSEREQRQIAEEKQHEAEEQKARAQKAEKETLADYRASTDDAIEQLIGSKPALGAQEKTYLEKTLKRWQVFAERTGDDERSRSIRAEGQFRVARLRSRLGQIEEAVAGYREALAIRQKLADEFPDVAEYRKDLASAHNDLGLLLVGQNKVAKAAEQYHKALDIQRNLAEEFPALPDHRYTLAATHTNLGTLLADQNQRAKAAEQFRMALAIWQKLADEFPAVPQYRHDLAGTHSNLGRLLAIQNQGAKAAEQYLKALAIRQKLADEFPAVPAYRDGLASTHNNLGNLLAAQNHREKAAEQYLKALAIRQKLADEFPAVPEYRHDLASSHNNLGLLLAAENQGEKAAEQYHRALDVRQKLANEFPAVPVYRKELAVSHINLGLLLAGQNQGAKVAEQYHKALNIQQTLSDEFPAVPAYRQDLARTHNNLGLLLMNQNQGEKAAEHHHKALDIKQKLADEFPDVPAYRQDLATTHCNLGNLLTVQNQVAKAAEQYLNALEIQQKLADEFPAVSAYQVHLGGNFCNYGHLLRGGGKLTESLPWYDKAIRTLTRVHQQDPRVVTPRLFLRSSHQGRALAYGQMEKHAEAVKDWNRSVELSPRQEQPSFRALRARSRMLAGQVVDAIAEVADLTKAGNWSASDWYYFACIYAVTSGKSADKKQEHTDRAMELLHKAVKAGFKDAAHLAKDKDLDALRGRGDFKKLLAEVEAGTRPKKTKEP